LFSNIMNTNASSLEWIAKAIEAAYKLKNTRLLL
jgi:hypothetical protein